MAAPDMPVHEGPMNSATGLQWFEYTTSPHTRFLFRGFHKQTGGGDPALNSHDGFIPHQYLTAPDLPRTLDTLTSQEMGQHVRTHMNSEKIPSRFTSWSSNFETALHFALGDPGFMGWAWHYDLPQYLPQYIAVLDTDTIANRDFRVVWAPDMGRDVPCEYIIYGPLLKADGVDFRIVDIDQIRRALDCRYWPLCNARPRLPHPVREVDMYEAAVVARLFARRPGDASEPQDVPMAVFAAELGRQQWPSPCPMNRTYRQEPQVQIQWTVKDMAKIRRGVRMHMPPALKGIPLANDWMRFVGFPQLKLMIDLLQDISWNPNRNDMPEDDSDSEGTPGANPPLHDCSSGGCLEKFGQDRLSLHFDRMLAGSVLQDDEHGNFSADLKSRVLQGRHSAQDPLYVGCQAS